MSKCQKYWKIGHNAKSIAGIVSTSQRPEEAHPRRAAGVAEQVLALPSTKVEKEVVWGQGGG